MIFMLAPAPAMVFGGMPSGATYVADQYGLLKLANSASADQVALANAGCSNLLPFAPTAFARSLISTTPFSLNALNWYGLRTGLAALTLNLPLLSSVNPGDWIELDDVDFNAETNNVTVVAAGSDTITSYGTPAASQILNIAGASCRLVAKSTTWSMMI